MHTRKSPRHPTYDYTSPGAYFITICTKEKFHYFGEIQNHLMVLNDLGQYTRECRKDIPHHYPSVLVDAFVCMPNHIHGIVLIGDTVGTQYLASSSTIKRTYNNTSLQTHIQPPSWSLWSIVRGFKIGVHKYAKQNNMAFARQWRYHDHIIRNQKAYENISHYIQTNPQRREEDIFGVKER